ncbi:MAG: energy transducer TonB, partial [Bacteroidota bacterium]
NGIEGQVYVGFVVDEKGRVSEVKTLRGIGHGCDEEAERVLENANNWLPGEVDGAPVKAFVVLPVVFKLS